MVKKTGSDYFIAVKYSAFIIFVTISSFISINLFFSLSSDSFDKYTMLAFAVSLELLKVFILIKANTLMHLDLKSKAWQNYAIYIGSVLISIIASFGFTLGVLDRSVSSTVASKTAVILEQRTSTLETYKSMVSEFEARIGDLRNQQATTPSTYSSTLSKLDTKIQQYEQKKSDIQLKQMDIQDEMSTLKQTLAEENNQNKNTSNVFLLMAKTFQGTLLEWLQENTIRIILLVLISIIIEIGIVITSPSVKIDEDHLIHFLGEDLSPDKIERIRNKLFGIKKEELIEIKKVVSRKPRAKKEMPNPKEETAPSVETVETVVKEDSPPVVTVYEEVEVSAVDQNNQPEAKVKVETVSEKEPPQKPEIKTRPDKTYNYVAGKMSQQKITHLLRFIDELFGEDQEGHYLNHPEQAEKLAEIPAGLHEEFFNCLKKVKGPTGLPMIVVAEINADTAIWSASYNLKVTKTHLSTLL